VNLIFAANTYFKGGLDYFELKDSYFMILRDYLKDLDLDQWIN
jgi:hypothetical protein